MRSHDKMNDADNQTEPKMSTDSVSLSSIMASILLTFDKFVFVQTDRFSAARRVFLPRKHCGSEEGTDQKM